MSVARRLARALHARAPHAGPSGPKARARRRTAGGWLLAAAACGRGPADAEAQGAALRHLFREREHGRQLVVWADAEPGPVFAAAGLRAAPLGAPAAAAVARATGLPVTRVTGADMARLFRAHPDGWAAFYARYPGAPGLVEVGAAERGADGATLVRVGRSCGEHCRHLWRVALPAAGAPAAVRARAAPLPVPE